MICVMWSNSSMLYIQCRNLLTCLDMIRNRLVILFCLTKSPQEIESQPPDHSFHLLVTFFFKHCTQTSCQVTLKKDHTPTQIEIVDWHIPSFDCRCHVMTNHLRILISLLCSSWSMQKKIPSYIMDDNLT